MQNSLSDIARDMLFKIHEFQNLSGNWDSYGAQPPSRIALKNAQAFIQENHFLALPFYFIAPGVNGEVMIEFKNGDKAAELFFLEDGSNEFLLYRSDEVEMEANLNQDFSKLIDFFNS